MTYIHSYTGASDFNEFADGIESATAASMPRLRIRRNGGTGYVEQLSELLLTLYRMAREQPLVGFQDAALNLIKPVLRFDSATWATGQLTAQGLVFHTSHLYQEQPSRLQDYEAVKDQDTFPYMVTRRLGITLNNHAPTMFRAREKAGIREYVRRHRHLNVLGTTHAQPETGSLHWVCLYRADTDHQYSERERRLCELLVPHFQQALRTNWILNLPRLPSSHGATRRQMAIADRTGLLYHVDPEFAALLQVEWPDWNGRRLPRQACEALLEQDRDRFYGTTIILTRLKVKDLWFLAARQRLPVDGLSARELAVARQIAAGRTYKEIARALGIAPATVRNHIQRIHDRLNVRSNAELVAQLKLMESSHKV